MSISFNRLDATLSGFNPTLGTDHGRHRRKIKFVVIGITIGIITLASALGIGVIILAPAGKK